MKPPALPIYTYDIGIVNAHAGMEMPANDFFVYKKVEYAVPEKRFLPARSTHFSIHLQTGGEIDLRCNLIDYQVKKNTLFIIAPGIVHEIVKESDHFSNITLGFTKEFLGKAMLHKKHVDAFNFFSPHSNPLFLLTDEEANKFYLQMLSLKNYYTDNEHPFKEEMMHHAFNLIMFEMAAITRKYRGTDLPKFTRGEDFLLKFIKLLSIHFKEERSVQFYANSLCISPKHLAKTVKEFTSKTCSEFIDDMVIVEAKILLSDFSNSVAQVADHLHFSDQFFFSKYFKKQTGLSPKEYKNSL